MRKPSGDDFEKFAESFEIESKKAGKKHLPMILEVVGRIVGDFIGDENGAT